MLILEQIVYVILACYEEDHCTGVVKTHRVIARLQAEIWTLSLMTFSSCQ